MTDCLIGLDTSNYTTSAAVCTTDGRIVANLKIPLPVKEGECGLRQSDAVFAHIKNLPSLAAQLQRELKDHRILAVACSVRPRDAEGSYMPCFLAGKAAAAAMAAPLDVPVYEFSHQSGHIMAAVYSSGASERLLQAPFAAFHVSGGTTELLDVVPNENGFAIELCGQTEDLNAGQAIDRVGVMMGLPFPCGKEMERLGATNVRPLPRPHVCVRNGRCNLSGLQNIAERMWKETRDRAYVSAFVLSFIGETLRKMTEYADACHPKRPIVYAGGVMSNHFLQDLLSQRPDTYFAEPAFSADNAAGIALLGRQRFLSLQS